MTRRLGQRRDHVLFQPVGDAGVLLDTVSETYFALNPVGARIYGLLAEHETFDALCSALAAEYPDVRPATLADDVADLLDELTRHGLLESTDGFEQTHPRQPEPGAVPYEPSP
jgi:hypothetical protein